jgi:hypothetical protein
MLYLIGVNAFGATRSLEHFWSGILDPIGFLYSDAISRYWTVVERNSQLFSWSVHSWGFHYDNGFQLTRMSPRTRNSRLIVWTASYRAVRDQP